MLIEEIAFRVSKIAGRVPQPKELALVGILRQASQEIF